jgi:hypothetical protein
MATLRRSGNIEVLIGQIAKLRFRLAILAGMIKTLF